MNRKKLEILVLTFLLVGTTVGAIIFVETLQYQNVPIWWVFRNLKSLQLATPSQLILEVSPETPHNIGEEITATVTNSSSMLPVQGAEVDITKDGTSKKVFTNANGIATFQYLGEVTVVQVQMDGINPSGYVAIPHSPDMYVQGRNNAIINGVVSGVLSSIPPILATYFIQRRKTTTDPEQPKRKIKRVNSKIRD